MISQKIMDWFGHMILDDFDERLQVGSLGPAGRPWHTMAFGCGMEVLCLFQCGFSNDFPSFAALVP